MLAVGGGRPRIERYWQPFVGRWSGGGGPAGLDDAFRRLFRQAVAEALEGPQAVGVLLSGGPDSSAVLGMAARLAREQGGSSRGPRLALTMVFDRVSGCDESARPEPAKTSE